MRLSILIFLILVVFVPGYSQTADRDIDNSTEKGPMISADANAPEGGPSASSISRIRAFSPVGESTERGTVDSQDTKKITEAGNREKRHNPKRTTGTLHTAKSGGRATLRALAQKYFPENPDIFFAICMAESGGRPNATHRNRNGSVDRGLAQVNSCHLAKAGYRADALYDPETNVRIARQIYLGSGRSFAPWTVYRTGAYRRYLDSSDVNLSGYRFARRINSRSRGTFAAADRMTRARMKKNDNTKSMMAANHYDSIISKAGNMANSVFIPIDSGRLAGVSEIDLDGNVTALTIVWNPRNQGRFPGASSQWARAGNLERTFRVNRLLSRCLELIPLGSADKNAISFIGLCSDFCVPNSPVDGNQMGYLELITPNNKSRFPKNGSEKVDTKLCSKNGREYADLRKLRQSVGRTADTVPCATDNLFQRIPGRFGGAEREMCQIGEGGAMSGILLRAPPVLEWGKSDEGEAAASPS